MTAGGQVMGWGRGEIVMNEGGSNRQLGDDGRKDFKGGQWEGGYLGRKAGVIEVGQTIKSRPSHPEIKKTVLADRILRD